MRVVVTLDARYERTPDGSIWTREAPAHRFWTRYLCAFDAVRVVARVRDVPSAGDGAHRVDGEGVEVWPLPCFVGSREYLRNRAALGEAVRAAADDGDAVVLRVPSPIGSLLATARERRGLPYALEVVADPYDAWAHGVIDHPVRPFLRRWFTNRLRRECRRAVAVSYVTERALQARYPSRPGAVTAQCSSVDLPAAAFLSAPRTPTRPAPRTGQAPPSEPAATLVSVGSLRQMYKGIDILMYALAGLSRTGTPLRLVHLGDGTYLPRLQQLARQLGLADRVDFRGAVPAGEAVRRHLDAADLFVLPSRTEGLPRALVEAMARGLPAIGTRVGGVPELLSAADLVPPDDPSALATAIRSFLGDPRRMAAASARNLARARDFSEELLTPRREAFYHAVAAVQHRVTGPRHAAKTPVA